MDQTLLVNCAIVVALMLFAVSTFLLVVFLVPVFMQAVQTLIAVQRLATTLEAEVTPTLSEFREVMDSVNQIRSVTAQRVNEVGHKVEDVAGSVHQVVDVAHKHSTVLGVGLLAGIKSYFMGKNHQEEIPENKQITMNKGDHHVESRQ